MKIKKQLKVLSIIDEKVIQQLPEEFENLFLKNWIKSDQWSASGSAFAGTRDFILWIAEDEEKKAKELLPEQGIGPQCIGAVEEKNNWFDLEINIIVETQLQ